MLAGRENLRRIVEWLAGDAAVLLWQEIHRNVNAAEVTARNRQGAPGFRPPGQFPPLVALPQLLPTQCRAGISPPPPPLAEPSPPPSHTPHLATAYSFF